MGGLFGWLGQHITLITTIFGTLAGGGLLTGTIRSFRFARTYERVLVTRFRKVVIDKETGKPKEYTGFVFRPVGFYRMTVVNIRARFDNIALDGVMRLTEDDEPHREKWELTGTTECHVEEGHVYDACEWEVNDLGEHIRGTAQDAIKDYLQTKPVSLNLETTKEIFEACKRASYDDMLKHGVVWDRLMINKFSLADAEIQGQATRKIAKAIEKVVAVIMGKNFNDGQITDAVEKWIASQLGHNEAAA